MQVEEPGATTDVDATTPLRRAPYHADSPAVGARGLRTKLRILDAALEVFDDHGYDRSTLDAIGQVAGCSRVSIYQYFASKDDVFRRLAGQAERQLRASMDLLDPITPDAAGRATLLAWVERGSTIHAHYGPVFRAFSAAAASDPALAGGAAIAGERISDVFEARIAMTSLPPRRLHPTVVLLLSGVNRALELSLQLRRVRPDIYTEARVQHAAADVMHRVLFGVLPEVNAGVADLERPPALPMSPALLDLHRRVEELEAESTRSDRRALAGLLGIGDDVVSGRGYRGTRVDDLVAAAGISRGSFYQYFENVDDFVRCIAARAINDMSSTIADLPDASDRSSLRQWLRRYNVVHAAKGPMIRVWLEAVDEALQGDRAAMYDWGRRQMVRLLAARDHGDVEVDAILLLAIMEAFGSVPRSDSEVEAALRVIECGFLGADI